MNPGSSPSTISLVAYRFRDGALIGILFGKGGLTQTVVGGQGKESMIVNNFNIQLV